MITKTNDLIEKLIVFITVLFLSAMVLVSFINISYCIDSTNLVSVFSGDEASIIKILAKNLSDNDLNPHNMFYHGFGYHTIAYFILKTYSLFDYNISDVRFIAYTLRAISVFSFIGLLFLFERSLKKYDVDLTLRLIFTLFLASFPSLYKFSQIIHPDLLQIFLLFLAFYILIDKITFKRIIYSTTITGLAFGTKYAGVFLLAFIFSVYFLDKTRQNNLSNDKKNIQQMLLEGSIILLVFVASWLILNPYVIPNFGAFFHALTVQMAFMARGHTRVASKNPFLWFTLLYKQFSPAGSTIIGTGILLLTYRFVKDFFSQKNSCLSNRINEFISDENRIVVLSVIIYCVIGFLHLMLRVNTRKPRFMLHVIPFIVWLSAYGISINFNKFNKSQEIKNLFSVLLVVPVILLSNVAIKNHSNVSRRYQHEYIKAGNWLKDNYPPSTRIIADHYSYLPPNYFEKVNQRYAGIDEKRIMNFAPDVIIINYKRSGRFSWKKKGTKFYDENLVLGEGKYDNTEIYFNFHKQLFSKDSKWRIVYEKENIVILEKKQYKGR